MSTLHLPPQPARRSSRRSRERIRDQRWRWWLLILLGGLTAVTTAAAVICFSAMQLSERDQAEALMARVVRSLLETDRFVAASWDQLAAQANSDEPIPLTGWPVDLALAPGALEQGPQVVADAITQATAQSLYEYGFDILQDEPQAVRFFSQASAFSSTIGRLTSGGHTVASVALGVVVALFVSLALATATQARGMVRLAAPGIAIGIGAALLLLAAEVGESIVLDRAVASVDPFTTDIWLIVADAIVVVARNARIAALFGGALSVIALFGWMALLWVEARTDR